MTAKELKEQIDIILNDDSLTAAAVRMLIKDKIIPYSEQLCKEQREICVKEYKKIIPI